MESQSEAVRSTITEWIINDVVGPRNGPEEELPKSENPTQSYLSGILFSKMSETDQEEDEQEQTEVDGGESDDDPQEERVSTMVNLRQSSFGLTCTVPNDISRIIINIEYGTYDLVPKIAKGDETTNEIRTADDVTGDKDVREAVEGRRKPMVYRRTSYSETHEIELNAFTSQGDMPLDTNEKFALRYYTKEYTRGRSLSVFVVNNHVWDGNNKEEFKRCMFQPRIVLSAHGGSKIFMDNKVHGEQNNDKTDESNRRDSAMSELLFRKKNNFATGHGCAVQWEDNPEGDMVNTLETTFVPKHRVPRIRPREMDVNGLDMSVLFKVTDMAEYRKLLSPVTDKYETWITEELEANVKTLTPELQGAAMAQIKECREALERIRRGIEIISTNKEAAEAFAFANGAMYLQMSYGRWAQGNVKNGRVDGPKPKEYGGKWRPFQIAFFLMNIESITNPHSENRGTADLLWFATGGGKTEAYLGIIAFTVAHRRLRNDKHMKYGTAAIMRYTLRLLTLQQFHRAATLMCGCEYIRRKNPKKWGKEPFLVGLWVGSSTTPNTLAGEYGAREAIRNAKQGNPPREHNPLQMTSCPWCGSTINAYCYEVSGTPEQCRIYCPNKICTFSKTGKGETNLPLLVVDEDIYKRCPSLVIGTVDKFAQMARKWETRAIFGRVNKHCQKHGFVTDELASNCNKHTNYESYLFSDSRQPQLEPPELIIQDELHLIAGPLGTLTGHYETAVDVLCTNAGGIRPKIIASTATTRGAPGQIQNLFNRSTSKIFPPQGIDFGQSFFAEEVSLDEDPGKVYVGICTTARSRLTILGRISAAILRCVRNIKEGIGQNGATYEAIDPYYTLVSYFNTLRELGGASKMYDDTVPRYIQRLFNNFETQNEEGNKYRNQHLEKVELTSRIDSSEIPKILTNLERKLDDEVNAEDLLLCTNMLSVGVDISRLGVMIVNGQPKNHSEYIQATGRIGRESPGLIVTSYNPLKPRDLSHYENFGYYHSTLHKNVEPVNLTPFASRARDRALFGIMVSLLRLSEKRLAENDAAHRFNKNIKFVSRTLDMMRKELADRVGSIDPSEQNATLAEMDRWIDKWHGWASDLDGLKYKDNQHEKAKRQEESYHLLKSTFHSDENGLVPVPDSLRDAEESIRIRYLDDSPYPNDTDAFGSDT